MAPRRGRPDLRWPAGKVATRVREAVESHGCYSLVSAPADYSAVVTNGDGDRPRRNQALALRDRWGAGDQVEGPGRAPAPGQLRWSVAKAGRGKGRRVLVSARTRRITWSAGVERERVTTWIRIRSPRFPMPGAAPPSQSPRLPPLGSSPWRDLPGRSLSQPPARYRPSS